VEDLAAKAIALVSDPPAVMAFDLLRKAREQHPKVPSKSLKAERRRAVVDLERVEEDLRSTDLAVRLGALHRICPAGLGWTRIGG
jgi:hypothetical protein